MATVYQQVLTRNWPASRVDPASDHLIFAASFATDFSFIGRSAGNLPVTQPYGFLAPTTTGTVISSTTSKFYSNSLYVPGNNGGVYYLGDPLLWIEYGDWTFEGWYYRLSSQTGNARLFGSVVNGDQTFPGADCYMDGGGTSVFGDGSATNFSLTLTTDAWVHVAFVRHAQTLWTYKNGVNTGRVNGYYKPIGSAIDAWGIGLGGNVGGNYSFNGYIQDARVYNTAKYKVRTGSFTPPGSLLSEYNLG